MARPPYILAHPADRAGCGHHRVIRPIEIMTRCGLTLGRFDEKVWADDMLLALKPDIVVWQRQSEEYQIENMRRYRKALPDAIFVYETDDALDAVPEASYHRPFIPHDINARMARAIGICDILSVSTRPLADHMRGVLEQHFDKGEWKLQIRVVPNMLGRDDFQAAATARMRARRRHDKPRVGWGGGISHSGDLALIKPAIEAIGDKVQWVFLGMKPEGLNAQAEFHQGVPPREYLAKLASLDLDLMLAPIEDNLFNRCKSNLRLIEGGACGYAVIASPVEPYVDGNPPVFSYANSMDEWITAIERFIALSPNQQAEHGNRLKGWAERHYCLDEKVEERAALWLKQKPFKPRRNTSPAGLTIVCPRPSAELAELGDIQTSLARACASTGDVLYVAPSVKLTSEQIGKLRNCLRGNIAAVSALSNDGGLCGFPKQFSFCPMNAEHGEKLDKMAEEMFSSKEALIPFPSGSVTLVSRRAIDSYGAPEACAPGREQEALIEWGLMVSTRSMRCAVAPDVYAVQSFPIQNRALDQAVRRGQVRYPPPTGISADPLKQIRSDLELAFHREMFTAPLVANGNGYPEWASYFDTPSTIDLTTMRLIADDLTHQEQAGGKNVVHPKFGIVAGEQYLQVEPQTWPHSARFCHDTFRGAIDNANELGCDWLVFARDGAIVRPHALWMLAERIARAPDASLIYADHDFIDKDGKRHEHDFKPEFDRHLLLGRDYITAFFAVRLAALERLFGPHVDEKISELSLYRLALILGDMLPREGIQHVPRVLAHLPGPIMDREKKAAAGKVVVANHVARHLGWPVKVGIHPRFPQYAAVSYLPPEPAPLVSIIIATKDKLDMLQPCVDSLLKLTKYQNFELLIIDNGSTNGAHLEYQRRLPARDSRVKLLSWPHPYNWSALNNWAVDQASGEYVVLLNDDTRIVDGAWLGEMVGAGAQPGVGAVGARLLYPHGMVQHVGVISSKGLTGHVHKGLAESKPGYNGIAVLSHEATAVTGACLLIHKQLFIDVDRLDEELANNFNDVALCLELRRRGFVNVVAAGAQVQHIEGATRTKPKDQQQESLEQLWAEGRILGRKYPEDDPYWNANLIFVHQSQGAMVSGLNMDMLRWPANPWPWRANREWRRERVLVIGDDGRATAAEVREGNAVYSGAVLEGTKFKILQPPLENTPAFDIRTPTLATPALKMLGVDRILLRSIIGAPVELISFLRRLEIPIVFAPMTAEPVCPRLEMTVDSKPCGNDELLKEKCSSCLWSHGSFFGLVSIDGWRDQWGALLKACKELDFTNIDENTVGAIKRVYGNELATTASPAL